MYNILLLAMRLGSEAVVWRCSGKYLFIFIIIFIKINFFIFITQSNSFKFFRP